MSDHQVVDIGADRAAIDDAIARACGSLPVERPPLSDVIRYTLRGPGKRLRGIMLCASYRAAGGTGDAAPIAAAVEMIHAYSLAHDDLPCMDDDDIRRGRPTTHRVYGVDATVVAGVAIIPIAAMTLYVAARRLGDETRALRAVRTLMRAAGAQGMIGGQLLDLVAEDRRAESVAELERIHGAKTGALIAASASIGGIVAGAPDASIEALGAYGADIGLAFQIVDDVLDVTASTLQLGKESGRDAELGKSTFPALLGVDGAMAHARTLVRRGCDALSVQGLLSADLRHLADVVLTRTH